MSGAFNRLRVALAALLLASGCSKGVHFDGKDIDAYPLGTGLKTAGGSFYLGAATAAHQIEGHNDNDWTAWEKQPGRIKNGDTSEIAADSWNQWPADVDALAAIGANAYRFSIEWSRLMPARGTWNDAAAAVYRAQLQALKDKQIATFVTLYHFTLPTWFAAPCDGAGKGATPPASGWECPDAIADFVDFVTRARDAFGDLVDHWITINELNVLVYEAYMIGEWPPGVKDAKRAMRVYATLIKAHAEAAAALHARQGGASVGVAHHVRYFQPASSSILDQTIAALTDDFINEALPQAISTGEIHLSIPGTGTLDEKSGDLAAKLAHSIDFFGLNYYERVYVRADLSQDTLSQQYVPAWRPKTDLGWDIYPEGLYRFLTRYASFRALYVTENGIAVSDDAARVRFLRANLYAVSRAIADGVNVQGYFYWSLMDNFEWLEGYSARFGLFAVDFADPARPRTARPSANAFREAAARLGAAR